MDGIELIQRARQQCPDTPIIVLTGTSSIDRVEQAVDAGATQVLTKWTPLDRIAETLKHVGQDGNTS
jgi:CheY-like chemotaxis protein